MEWLALAQVMSWLDPGSALLLFLWGEKRGRACVLPKSNAQQSCRMDLLSSSCFLHPDPPLAPAAVAQPGFSAALRGMPFPPRPAPSSSSPASGPGKLLSLDWGLDTGASRWGQTLFLCEPSTFPVSPCPMLSRSLVVAGMRLQRDRRTWLALGSPRGNKGL